MGNLAQFLSGNRTFLTRQQGEILCRVDPFAVEVDLKVHVTTRGVPRRAGESQKVTLLHTLTLAGHQQRIMAIGGFDAASVIDADSLTRMSSPRRLDDPTSRRRPDRGAARDTVVLTNVDIGSGACGIQTPAEATGDPGAFHRCGEGQATGQQPCGASGDVVYAAA